MKSEICISCNRSLINALVLWKKSNPIIFHYFKGSGIENWTLGRMDDNGTWLCIYVRKFYLMNLNS